MPRFWSGSTSITCPIPAQRFVPIAPVRVCVVQYQMRLVASFQAFAEQCEYFLDVASEYKCDFIVFPEIFTTQLLSLVKADNPAMAMRKLSEFTPSYLELFTRLAVKYNVNIIGGSHFTLEGDDLFNIVVPVPPRRHARQAIQAAHHAERTDTGGASRGAIASRCSTPTRARSPSPSATTSNFRR